MAASEHPAETPNLESPLSRADAVWVAVCFAVCGGWAVYLFTPYLVPSLRSSAALVGVGLAAAIVFAVVGILLTWKRR